MPHRTIPIRVGAGYDALVGPGTLGLIPSRLAGLGARIALLAHDSGLPGETVEHVAALLRSASLRVETLRIHAVESRKTLSQAESILARMAGASMDRRDVVVALGGGLTGDLAGFAAGTYRRGIRVIQCPTTLLAMVDAAVGGKTAVNLPAGGDLLKNMAGVFHQPAAVIADVSTLRTLAPRTLRCGLAECLKHGMLSAQFGDPDLLPWTVGHLASFLALDKGRLTELVARNIAVKASVVAGDEREEADAGGRALLNLGHTFGHAIETLPTLRAGDLSPPLQHGEAVALGLIAAAFCASCAGLCSPSLADQTRQSIVAAGLPTQVHGLPPGPEMLRRMAQDKKVLGGVPRLVLPVGPGRAEVVAAPSEAAVLAGIDAIRS